jgi:hypothetical protein
MNDMTLKQIKAMFVPGEKWHCRRDATPMVVHGNLGTTILPNKDPETDRAVFKLETRNLIWLMPDGKKLWTDWPPAANIIEARAGFLKFKYPGAISPERDITITFTKLP